MKTKLFTLLVLAGTICAKRAVAQSVFASNDSHVWYTYTDNLDTNSYVNVHYFTLPTNADTIINSITYKKYYYEYYEEGSSPNYSGVQLTCFVRYDSVQKNVYALFRPFFSFEYLMYKFNIQVGDTLHNLTRTDGGNIYTSTFVVHNGSNTLCADAQELYLMDTATQNPRHLNWFKNVGSEFRYINEIIPTPSDGYSLKLKCVSDTTLQCPKFMTGGCNNITSNSSLDNGAVSNIVIAPNPSNGLITLHTNTLINGINIINSNGIVQPVNYQVGATSTEYKINATGLQNGVYILQIISNSTVIQKLIIINHN